MSATVAVFIVDAVRTPVGRIGGAYARIRPDDLAAATIAALVDRVGILDPVTIDDVVFGNANGAGEENRNVARMASLLAGLPTTVPGVTVNRLCGSGLEAVVEASRAIAVGDSRVCIAGGVESMTRAPWVMQKPEQGFARGDAALVSTTLGWRLVNPRMLAEWTISLGEGAELLAERSGISREEQDRFAVASHDRAAQAWKDGAFDAERVVMTSDGAEPLLAHDENIRTDSSLDMLARLQPSFRSDGTVTAGNASPLSDGAAALLLADEATAGDLGSGLARIVSSGVSGIDPPLYGLGPVEAARRAMERAGLDWSDLGAVELNEAFAAQALACLAAWPELDPSMVNTQGGAIAIGHPIGSSGARILTTLAQRMHREQIRFGLAVMCIGVGQGIAMVLEAA